MSGSISLPTGITAKCTSIEVWMDRTLELSSQVSPRWDAGQIHDLRVALRRSRTMAEALNEVNPAPGWKKIKKSSRELFHALGGLRDVQVESSWIKQLGEPGDPVRKHMLRMLAQQERKHRKLASQALEDFDRKSWRRWSRKLSAKARFFPLESVVYQRVALARLNEAVELYQQARGKRSSVAWHRLRIGVKHFRYVVENFLPQRYEVWVEDLKHMQDLLGEVHDLDVLRSEISKQAFTLAPTGAAQWLARIRAERKARLDEFLAMASAKDSPWVVWRAGFPWGHARVAAPFPERPTRRVRAATSQSAASANTNARARWSVPHTPHPPSSIP
jgi:CHAD domain-containing protein